VVGYALVRYGGVWHCLRAGYGGVWYGMVRSGEVWYGAIRFGEVRYGEVWHRLRAGLWCGWVWCGLVWHGMAQPTGWQNNLLRESKNE